MDRTNTQPDMPMKWHKFLIYFSLWAGALLLFFGRGVLLITGAVYGGPEAAARVYSMYDGLKAVDMLFGALYCAVAVYMIYTRFQLAGFRSGAPDKLIACYALQLVVYLGYMLAVSSVAHLPFSSVFDTQSGSAVAVSIAMIFINRAYYAKRIHLFEGGPAPGDEPGGGTVAGGAGFDSGASAGAPACPNCGARVEGDDLYCVQCGTRLRQ